MDEADRKFYMLWGLAIALIGIEAALAYMRYWALGTLIFFGGVGVALVLVSGKDNVKFYGGIGFLLLGILLYSIIAEMNILLTVIAIVIVIGGLIAFHGLRGERK